MKDLMRRSGKYLTITGLFVIVLFGQSFTHANNAPAPKVSFTLADSARFNVLYDSLQLDELGLSSQAFHKAVNGFLHLVALGEITNPGVLSIIDFSLPSSQKRLFVLDTYNGKLLFNTLVAHGRNSGQLLATRFSNRRNSFMSSLGFYLTGDTFIGQHGYSMRLEGMEKGVNDHVFSRAIIMHPADYVSEEHIQQWGYLGRSEGCPAIPEEVNRPIIDEIQGGSCLYIYGTGTDKKYKRSSNKKK
ncbi:MAG: murein L,D-transpeptidase catalytic domain family protein [Bacteroidetes bacterium]|nr:murein L,D-transpeptidase catalytic domain family protein [Bacteroidota bacterium]